MHPKTTALALCGSWAAAQPLWVGTTHLYKWAPGTTHGGGSSGYPFSWELRKRPRGEGGSPQLYGAPREGAAAGCPCPCSCRQPTMLPHPPLPCANSDGPSARPCPPRSHVPAPAGGEAAERSSSWSRRTGSGQESLSLFSQQGLKCLCLAPAWPQLQLETPGSIEGAADVMQDPAELKMGWETSVPSGTAPPPGGWATAAGEPCRLRAC